MSAVRSEIKFNKNNLKMGAGASSINGKEIVALDCEMVEGMDYNSILARVSIVNYHGAVIFDSFVSSQYEIGDYRTPFSGVRPEDLDGAPSFSSIQGRVRRILSNKIVVGHSLDFDFNALQFNHAIENKRDIGKSGFIISRYGTHRRQPVSLKTLAYKILNRSIQVGEHDSIEDATASMDIYKHYQREIEEEEQQYSVAGRAMEMEPEQESGSIGAGTVVVAGIAAASAIAAFSYFTRNNRND